MGVLGNIAKKLRGDFAEDVRASRDIGFSRQLTASRFAEKAAEKRRGFAEKVRAEDKKDEAQAAQRKEKFALQTKLVNSAFDAGRESGDFSQLVNVVNNPDGELLPNVQSFGKQLIQAKFGKSFEVVFKEQQLKNQARQMTNTEKNTLLRETEIDNIEARFQQKFIFDEAKLAYDKGIELAKKNKDITNTEALVASMKSATGIFTDGEIQTAVQGMQGTDSDNAIRVYLSFWTRYSQKLNSIRAAASKRGEKPPIQTDASKFDKEMARQLLVENVPEFSDLDTENQADTMVSFLASKVNSISRAENREPFEVALEVIKKDIPAGIGKDDDYFESLREFTFSAKRATELTEDNISATMSKDPQRYPTRESVIAEWERRNRP